MEDLNRFLDAFINGDTFIIFMVVMLMILLVLIIALFKTKTEYNEITIKEKRFESDKQKVEEVKKEEKDITEDLTLESLKAVSEDDKFDENKPLIKQVDINSIQKYKDNALKYEELDEENAVISADELEKRAKERLENLGSTENQEAIQKYEEEQEKKAIISYEQLLKNASNITLSYKEEKKDKNAPSIKKVEVEQKEVTGSEIYLEEEEFLKILKAFRISLE